MSQKLKSEQCGADQNKIIIGPKDCYLTETENSSDKTRNGYHRNLAQYSTVKIRSESKYQNQRFVRAQDRN